MNTLLEYYKMKNDTNTNTVYFERVKEEDIRICGKTLKEIIMILNGLEAERITGIKLCMENVNKYIDIILKEQQEQIKKSLTNFLEKR